MYMHKHMSKDVCVANHHRNCSCGLICRRAGCTVSGFLHSLTIVPCELMTNYHEITHCRVCGTERLMSVLNLGKQALTGVFPRKRDETLTSGPLELVWCMD